MVAEIYPPINGTLLGNNLGYIFVYANEITGGFAFPFLIISFFIITLVGSLFFQMRFTGRMRIETSVAAASFVTFGIQLIFLTIMGLDLSWLFWANIALCILSVIGILMTPNIEQ